METGYFVLPTLFLTPRARGPDLAMVSRHPVAVNIFKEPTAPPPTHGVFRERASCPGAQVVFPKGRAAKCVFITIW